MIVSSFLQQYGIRILSNDFQKMCWNEFRYLLIGISPDTALGRVVAIRAETDRERIKEFTPDQRRIWSEWRNKRAKQVSKKDASRFYADISRMFWAMVEGQE